MGWDGVRPTQAGAGRDDPGAGTPPCQPRKSKSSSTPCIPRWWADDHGVASAGVIGRLQAAKAAALWRVPAAPAGAPWPPGGPDAAEPLAGPVGSDHAWLDMANASSAGSRWAPAGPTCPPAMGFSFAAGTTDGPGAFDFTQGDTRGNAFWRIVRDALHDPSPESVRERAGGGWGGRPSPGPHLFEGGAPDLTPCGSPAAGPPPPAAAQPAARPVPQPGAPTPPPPHTPLPHSPNPQVACHAPKPILLDTGHLGTPYPWQPTTVEVSVLRIGQLAIAAVPGEMTAMAGRRAVAAVEAAAKAAWAGTPAPRAVVAGLANTYASYITTHEEYQAGGGGGAPPAGAN